MTDGRKMRHFAIVGSGPAGFYTAEALKKSYGENARIDILDRYPVPYGLIRFGVAPDHQSLKAVSKRYDKVAESAGVDFIGNVTVGQDVSIAELLELYDAVILATGAPHDRKLGIPGEDLPGVIGSAEFVGWYNGHPEFADLDPPLGGTHAAVIGNGNVALDCARILSKTRHEFEGSDIVSHALDALDSRRSAPSNPRQARPAPDRDDAQGARRARPSRSCSTGRRDRRLPARRSRRAARAGPAQIGHPAARIRRPGSKQTQAHRLRLLRQAGRDRGRRQGRADDRRAHPTGRERRRARAPARRTRFPHRWWSPRIGYSTSPIPASLYERRQVRQRTGKIADRLYAVGWARRGPSGTIGTNRPDGYEVAEQIAAAMPPGGQATKRARRA